MAKASAGLGTREFLVLLWAAAVTYTSLYGPQPLLSTIRQYFGVSSQAAGLVMTLAVLPLGLAPVCYGYVLNLCSTRRLIAVASALAAVLLFCSAACENFLLFLVLRCLSGLIFPAVMLSVMTHLAVHCAPERLQTVMVAYSTATLIGAFVGRIGSGLLASLTEWHVCLLVHGLLMASVLPFLGCLRSSAPVRQDVFSPRHVLEVLRQPGLASLMLIGPLCIFGHASVLNLAPFRMTELLPGVSEGGIGLVYLPAFVCCLLGVFSRKITRLLHGEMHNIRLGTLLVSLSAFLLLIPSPVALFLVVLGITCGFVLVYTTLPGVVNRVSRARKSMTNGVYLSFYYLSAALGTWLPLQLYGHFGVPAYLACLLCAFFLALFFAHRNIRAL